MTRHLAMISFPARKMTAWATSALMFALTVLLATGAGRRSGTSIPGAGLRAAVPGPARVLTPDLCFRRWSIGDLQLSPDGKRLAMVVAEPAGPTGQRRNLWIYDFSTRALEQFTFST